MINPASKNKRSYWVNEGGKTRPKTPAEWNAGAVEKKGSWWPEWAKFLVEHGGKEVAPPAQPGNAQYPAIEPAPGRYVKARAD